MRRVHLPDLRRGTIPLDPRQAHHLRHVLRLGDGEPVEAFDDRGRSAAGILRILDADRAAVELLDEIRPAAAAFRSVIASAVPKGNRADWMIEKLGELGVSEFLPLVTARGVVIPAGRNKLQRWQRIATEAARQSRSAGVMRITAPLPLEQAAEHLASVGPVWHLSPDPDAPPASEALRSAGPSPGGALLIGPEGGWTDGERDWLIGRSIPPLRLGRTILRIETAAVAAAVLLVLHAAAASSQSSG